MARQDRPQALRRRRVLLGTVAVATCLVGAVVVACDMGADKDKATGKQTFDGGLAAPRDAGEEDAGDAEADADAEGSSEETAVLRRGRYLVDHVAGCGDCHTPGGDTPDPRRYLGGVECLLRDSHVMGGCLSSANLTNDSTGLARRSDAEIKAMILDGRRPEGTALHPLMPYWVYHNMTDEDADAIVAYLRTVRGVNHIVPPKSVGFLTREPAAPIDPGSIPKAKDEAGERGRYLATMAGRCLECHTADARPGSIRPIDMTKAFGGNRAWSAKTLGLASPPAPETIYSANITPAGVTGIGLWSAADLKRAISEGRNNNGAGLCPPHPKGTYRGLSEEDVSDIAAYVLTLPKIDKFTAGKCSAE